MKTVKILGAMTFLLLGTISCKRKENNTAGKGGSAVLTCIPEHHKVSKNIINGKIFIAYNKSDIPAFYDDSASCILIDGVPTATFNNLKTGKYYLLGTGFDTSINQAVKGGLSQEITQQTNFQISVPVTETH